MSLERELLTLPRSWVRPAPMQPRREFDPAKLRELAQSLEAIGQQVPIIVYPESGSLDRYLIADGERRWRGLEMIGKDTIEAISVAGPLTDVQLLCVQLTVNEFRERLKPYELLAAYARIMQVEKLSQSELAARLGVSESKISNAFALRRIHPDLRGQVELLDASIGPEIARLPLAAQAEAVRFASTAGADGKLPSRDAVRVRIGKLKRSTGSKGKGPKPLKGKIEGREFVLAMKPGDTAESTIEALKAIIARLMKNKDIPPDGWGFLFGN